jgi:cohesin complex subunit SA-1/2
MKKFRASFSEFWKKSAAKIPRDLLVDGSFVATLLHWLINMCASGLRPFRHTAMIAVYRFADSLIARDFHDAASKAARVAKSTTGKKSSEDAKSLTRAASVVDGYLNEIFNVFVCIELSWICKPLMQFVLSVFQNRFRDISEEIRIDSVVALGDWVIKHPPLFLDNTRLKYIGWMLSDTSAVVRRAAVGVIEKLFQRDEFAPQLEKFATYYRKRLVAMVLDKDSQTAAEAIRVIGFLHKYGSL